MKSVLYKLATTLAMIKFEHTLFALPFAFLGAILAADGFPTWWQIIWITVAMFGARSAAMTFNRIVDRDIDKATREQPDARSRAESFPSDLPGPFFIFPVRSFCWPRICSIGLHSPFLPLHFCLCSVIRTRSASRRLRILSSGSHSLYPHLQRGSQFAGVSMTRCQYCYRCLC